MADCHRALESVQILHSVNLGFLAHFFKENELSEFYSTTLLDDPLKVLVPQLKIFQLNMSHEIQEDKRARFDLTELANLTRNDQLAFGSLAERMAPDWLRFTSGDFGNEFNFFSWKSWLLVATTLTAVAGFSLAILLNYRIRILAATVTSLSMLPRGHSLPTELNYF